MPVDFQEEAQEKQGIDFVEEPEVQGPPEAPLLPLDIAAPQMPVPAIDFTKTSGRPPLVEQSPFVSPFHFTQLVPPTRPEESSAMGITKGLTRTALSIPEFALSPAGFLSAEVGTVAPRFVTAAFSVDMLGNTLKEIPEVYAQWQKMSPGQKWDAGISIALGTLMGLGLAAKTVKGFQKQPLGMSDEAHRQAVESTTSYAEDNPGFVQYLRRLVQQRRPVPERESGPTLPPTLIQPPSEEQRQPVTEGPPSVPTAGVAAVTAAGEAPAVASEAMRQRVEAVRQAGKTAPAAAAEAAKTIADEAVKSGRAKVESAPAEPAAPASELEMAVPKPDFIADNSEPFGSDRWRMKNGVGPDDKLIQIEDGGWVSESPPMNVKGQWAKFVRTVNAKGEGKVIPVNVEAPKKGVIYAPEEGKVKEGVQPERVGTDAQRLSAATGPRDSVQPETPVGQEAAAPPGQAPREVLLKPKEPWEMTQKEYVDKDISIRTSTRKPSDDFLERLREQARLDHQTAVGERSPGENSGGTAPPMPTIPGPSGMVGEGAA